jgi:hypothetical protein
MIHLQNNTIKIKLLLLTLIFILSVSVNIENNLNILNQNINLIYNQKSIKNIDTPLPDIYNPQNPLVLDQKIKNV